MPHLLEPITLRGVTLAHRIAVSPMCQYSATDGFISDWHLVHLGSRAVGGASLVVMEATAVTPEGRISPQDTGLWSDAHVEPLTRLCKFLRQHGAVPGIQLAHAGRKASTWAPWEAPKHAKEGPHAAHVPEAVGGWMPIAPSALAFAPDHVVPRAMSIADIRACQDAFVAAARRAKAAGFQWIELHAAHGYLAHSFLSPLANQRTDDYGGSFRGRCRFVLETVEAVRGVWPQELPLALRISASDWAEGGWTLPDSIALAKLVGPLGIDLIDCSSGGMVPHAKIPAGASYQVPFAEAVKREAGVATGAVGLITEPMQADDIIRNGRADVVFLAREMLRDPYWAWRAARALRHPDAIHLPLPYDRAAQ